MDLNDALIARQCQSGKLEEFAQLYDKYIRKIYDFIYFKTTHKETAEDLTSLTFFKALENINKYNEAQGTFSAWLYRIARNTVIDHYRTKKNNANIDDIWDLSENNDITRDIDTKDKLASIEKYMANLPAEQREIIIMRAWQEMSYKEIAEIIGKNEDACKMSFSRAIKKLRSDMPLALFLLFILNSQI